MQKEPNRTLREWRDYYRALLPGLGGAAIGSAFFIVLALVAHPFEVGPIGLLMLALWAGGCGGYLFGRHVEASERAKQKAKIAREKITG
jgi:hypothetical protein